MDNLSLKFEGFVRMFGSEQEAVEIVDQIVNNKIRERVVDTAKEYYAKKFNCKKEEVFWGLYYKTKNDGKVTCPYAVIVGDAVVSGCTIEFPKLKAVTNRLLGSMIITSGLDLLEYATVLDLSHTDIRKLPQLKHVVDLILKESHIESLNVEECNYADLSYTNRLQKFNLKKVNRLDLDASHIKDISSLLKADEISAFGCPIKKVNPRLEVHFIEEDFEKRKLKRLIEKTKLEAGLIKKEDCITL